ncbi:MAG: hypothetical protein JNM36_08285 [Chitinophagales bacterium]|nr:hypothetical protein [Chitinophagales bacterium]
MLIKNLSFYISTYPSRSYSSILFYFEPSDVYAVFQYYQDVCRKIEEFDAILIELNEQRKIQTPTKNLGRNDSSLIVYREKCVLDCEFVSGLPPLEVPTNDVIYFFTEFRYFFIKYISCQIPGIIPPSKLDTWSCVPNEYVKPEYWELLKQQTEGRE